MKDQFKPHWYEPQKGETPSSVYVWAVSYTWTPYQGFKETLTPRLIEKKDIPQPPMTDTKYLPAYPEN